MRPWYALILLWGLSGLSQAEVRTLYPFGDPAQAALFQEITQQVRCVVCQNQSLADSYAPLAQDLRWEIYEWVQAGHPRTEIMDHLVARYGEWVRFDVPWSWKTGWLWVLPVCMLLYLGQFLWRGIQWH